MLSDRAFGVAAVATALLFAAGCGDNSQKSLRENEAALVVNRGPNGRYANGLFTTVNVCAPGTSNCQAITGVLVDTGSFGLRILSSAITSSSLSSALTKETDGAGRSIAECAQFADGITWGPVVRADVQIGGERASAIPIQIIGEPSLSAPPSSCTDHGAPEDDLASLQTNGILGVGNFVQDCPECGPGLAGNPGFYYGCSGSSCQVTTVRLSEQVANPVASFAANNNGEIIELPQATSATMSMSGTMVFGIGTESNNALGGAHVIKIDPSRGDFNTTFNNKSYPGFLDTGSNGYFFLGSSTTGLAACPVSAQGFYCPPSRVTLSATNRGANNLSSTVSFSIDNALSLFSMSGDSVFPTLGGPFGGMFDWGLPFFYGRNVFVAIFGASTPGGAGPYWAY
ncbi:MAG: DUF3443 family protein [Acidobacteria bacterium]|nr:DUF3443 family protein [Acidobacteriota bacterium]